jgi:hypothetical protein
MRRQILTTNVWVEQVSMSSPKVLINYFNGILSLLYDK